MDIKGISNDLIAGKPILIFDFEGREGEVDMVYYAGSVNEESIYRLRTEAGGLICYATSMEVAKQLGIPIIKDVLHVNEVVNFLMNKGPSYGESSTFSLWINHINVKTGISDKDRALTVKRLHDVTSLVCEGRLDEARRIFINEFYFPGHIPVLISKGLKHRRGHTELSVELALMVGLKPSVVFAEMLDKGTSLSFAEAEVYAKKNNLKLIRGEEIMKYLLVKGVS